jgi:molybdopterin converting factor small subunit
MSFVRPTLTSAKESVMAVTVHLPGHLRDFAGGHSEVVLPGSPETVLDALELLWQLHPGIRDRLVNEQGDVREHINIFVGEENIRFTGGLATPVPEGSEIFIIPALSSGA